MYKNIEAIATAYFFKEETKKFLSEFSKSSFYLVWLSKKASWNRFVAWNYQKSLYFELHHGHFLFWVYFNLSIQLFFVFHYFLFQKL